MSKLKVPCKMLMIKKQAVIQRFRPSKVQMTLSLRRRGSLARIPAHGVIGVWNS